MKFIVTALLALVIASACSKNEEVEKTSQASPHSEYLKDFNWLAGAWEEKTDKGIVTSTYQWDINKNFLIQHFTAVTQNEDSPLEGFQIFGWDPARKQIRSWIFDSDGGFGEVSWAKQDSTWYGTTTFTLPDGRMASTTHIYKKIDDNTFEFSSEERDIDGIVMPNIGPFTVKRQQVKTK